MTFLWAVLIGLVLGALSIFLAQRKSPGLLVVRSIIGIVGGGIGGFVATLIAPPTDSGLRISIAGVVILLILWFFVSRSVEKRKKT